MTVTDLLGILPPLLIAVLLICGRYPGEELIVRVAARRRFKPRARVALLLAMPPGKPGWSMTRLRFLRSSRPLRGPPSRLSFHAWQ